MSNLQILTLSESLIQDQDLIEISRSKFLQNLQEIYIDNCQKCTIAGLNSLNRLPNLQLVSFKNNRIIVDDIQLRPEIKLKLNQIKIKCDNENEFIQKTFNYYVKSNIKNMKALFIQNYSTPLIVQIAKSTPDKWNLKSLVLRTASAR